MKTNSDANSPNMLLSGSRDKTLIIWNLTRDEQAYGYPKRSLEGHSHIVSDCVCSRPQLQKIKNPNDKEWKRFSGTGLMIGLRYR